VLTVRQMYATDLERGFLDALSALKPCGLTHEEAVAVFRKRMRQKVRTYVALQDGKVVGTASLIIEPKFIHNGGVVGHIEDVAVHPQFQQHGIGAVLIRHILDECREARCYKVILDCVDAVVPFYEKFGFRRWEHALRLDL
jgi:glucosamine-phosphate N-acetyltransferase